MSVQTSKLFVVPQDVLQYVIRFLIPPFKWWIMSNDRSANHLYFIWNQIHRSLWNPIPWLVCTKPSHLLSLSRMKKLIFNADHTCKFGNDKCRWSALSYMTQVTDLQIVWNFSNFLHLTSLLIDFQNCSHSQSSHIVLPPHLKNLVLRGYKTSGSIRCPDSLEILQLDYVSVADILLNSSLKELDIHGSSIPILTHLYQLQILHLRHCQFHQMDHVDLPPSLTYIQFEYYALARPDLIQTICESLIHLPNLAYLQVSVATLDYSFLSLLTNLKKLFLPSYINVYMIPPIQAEIILLYTSAFEPLLYQEDYKPKYVVTE